MTDAPKCCPKCGADEPRFRFTPVEASTYGILQCGTCHRTAEMRINVIHGESAETILRKELVKFWNDDSNRNVAHEKGKG